MKINDGSLKKTFTFRFYAELNDFLPPEKRQKTFNENFKTPISVRETIESIGVPLSEVDLVLVNGETSDLGTKLSAGDRITVYPVFEVFDISGLTRIRKEVLRETKFILDAHLGKLAKYLRMLGFDTLYSNSFDDDEIIRIANVERRIILTRDKQLLKSPLVTHGYFVRETEKHAQLKEIVNKFDLYSRFKSFTRCMTCNSELVTIGKPDVSGKIEDEIALYYNEFYSCRNCNKIFWKGTHFMRMENYIKALVESI